MWAPPRTTRNRVLRDELEYIKYPVLYQIIIDTLVKIVYNYTHAQFRAALKGKSMYKVGFFRKLGVFLDIFADGIGVLITLGIFCILLVTYFNITDYGFGSTSTWVTLVISAGALVSYKRLTQTFLSPQYRLHVQAMKRLGLTYDQLLMVRALCKQTAYNKLLIDGSRKQLREVVCVGKLQQIEIDYARSKAVIDTNAIALQVNRDQKAAITAAAESLRDTLNAVEWDFQQILRRRRIRKPMNVTPSSPPGHARDRRVRLV